MRAVDAGSEATVSLRDPRVPGLSLTVGRRSARWAFSYKAPLPAGGWSSGRRLVLGDLAGMDVDEAREAALAAKAQVASGIDPVAAKRARRAANVEAAASRTVAAAIERFVEERGADWTEATRKAFRRDFEIIRDAIGDAPMALVDRPRLVGLIEDYVAASQARGSAGLRQATRVAGLLGALWRQASVGSPRYAGWAWPGVEALVAARLPVAGRHRITARRRVLSEGEIRDLWLSLRAPGPYKAHRTVMALSLLTGARVGALALLDEADLDLDPEPVVGTRDSGPTFTIRAAEGRKVTARDRREGADLVLPLAPMAVDLLREALAVRRSGSAVFEQRGGKPLVPGGVTRAWGKLVADGLAPADATAHDLRRSMRTHLGELDHGGDWGDEERLLGHKLGGAVAQAYDRGRRLARLRPLADAWGARLAQIVAAPPAEVARLRGRA
jgi:integrase